MKLKIKRIETEIVESTIQTKSKVKLKLEKCESGIDVVSVGKNGNIEFRLIRFDHDGTIYRYHSVPDPLGFKLNESGQIEIQGEL